MKKIVCLFALMSVTVAAQAEGIDTSRLYIGGGLNFNSLPGAGSARGVQFFGGYELATKMNDDITTSLELGYMDSGKFENINNSTRINAANGMWASVVEAVPVSTKVDVLARLGYDFGDDDGVLLGTGVQYKFNTKSSMRMEYVSREHITGLQANVFFKF